MITYKSFQANRACRGLLPSWAHICLVLLISAGSAVLPGPWEACAVFSAADNPAAIGHLPLALYPATHRTGSAKDLTLDEVVITAESTAPIPTVSSGSQEQARATPLAQKGGHLSSIPVPLTVSFPLRKKSRSNRPYWRRSPLSELTCISKWSIFSPRNSQTCKACWAERSAKWWVLCPAA